MGLTAAWCIPCEQKAYVFGHDGSITQFGYVEPFELTESTGLEPIAVAATPPKVDRPIPQQHLVITG